MLQTLGVGIVCGFIAVVLALSLGNLLFFGEMRDFVPVALGMSLFTTMIVGVIASLTSPIKGVVSIAEEIPIVAIAGPAAAITASMIDHAPREDIAITIVVAAMLATIATGAALLFLGYFQLGRLIRYVPFPVIAGFLAGTGWLIVLGGLGVMIGDVVSPGSIGLLLDPVTALKCGLGVGFAGLIAVLVAKAPSPLAFPIAIFVALVLFNLAVAVFDIPAPLLRQDGWVVPMLAGTALWPPILPADISSVDWTAIIPTAVMLPGIIVVSVMAIMMNASGIELATRRDIELDQELLSVGLQNVVAGSGGGIPGYPAVSLSVLANRLGAGNRGVGIVGAVLVARCPLPRRGGSQSRSDAPPRQRARLDRGHRHLRMAGADRPTPCRPRIHRRGPHLPGDRLREPWASAFSSGWSRRSSCLLWSMGGSTASGRSLAARIIRAPSKSPTSAGKPFAGTARRS